MVSVKDQTSTSTISSHFWSLTDMKHYQTILPSATKLGQGYIFTDVCDSVHRGGAWSGGVPGQVGTWSGGCLVQGVPGGDPLGRLLLWTVCILLECILVREGLKISFDGSYVKIGNELAESDATPNITSLVLLI